MKAPEQFLLRSFLVLGFLGRSVLFGAGKVYDTKYLVPGTLALQKRPV